MTEPRAIGADDPDLVAGQVVGEYIIERVIGTGGFGTVYKAAHPLIGKVGAIKVLKRQYSALPEMVSRFVAEARAVNQIRHRNIIDIFGFGQVEDGRHYYVMELLEGTTLDVRLAADGPIPFADAIPIFRAIGRALDAAHAKGIAHRDLKPANIFLATEVDGTVFPKLLDFGIAKLLVSEGAGPIHKTRTGSPIGTPYYMSPEQCRGRDVDHRTDVYALGVVIFEVLTGKVPFNAGDAMDVLFAQVNEPPPLPSSIRADLPESVDRAVTWMLMKEPAARPSSAGAAVVALEDAALAAGVAFPPAPTPAATTGPKTPGAAAATTGRKPQSIAEAPTLDADRLTPPPPEAATARRVLPLVALAAAALLVGGYLTLRDDGDPPAAPAVVNDPAMGAPGSAGTATGAAGTTGTAAVTAGSAGATSGSRSAAPPETALVSIEVVGTPLGTEVLYLGSLVGAAPGTVRLMRSNETAVLVLKADGYLTTSITVTPDRAQTIKATLQRKPRPGGPARPRDQLGPDPFHPKVPR